MLALTNIALRRGTKVLIENSSLQIHAGQRMGVIGANGCGKSSLVSWSSARRRALDGLRDMFVAGADIRQLPRSEARIIYLIGGSSLVSLL